MRCEGTTQKGTQCRKTVLIDSTYCAQHESQEVEVEEVEEEVETRDPCARCGPKKDSVQNVPVGPGIEVPLCMSCLMELLRMVFEFTGVENASAKLLEIRESVG